MTRPIPAGPRSEPQVHMRSKTPSGQEGAPGHSESWRQHPRTLGPGTLLARGAHADSGGAGVQSAVRDATR